MPRPIFRISPSLHVGLVALALAGFSAAAQAPIDVRIALVIGNASYPGGAALANPLNDAQAMGAVLRKVGFTVVEVRDGSRAQMTDALELVSAALRGKQGVGMLYYAGHGLQLDWRNYMVPVDARLRTAADVPAQSVDVSAVIAGFKAAGNRMNIVVLDACRDNPFQGTGTGKGLAQQDAPPGTFLAYATAPGNVADDGEGGNGLYTGFLLQELAKPATRIEDVFKRVRLQVRQKSEGRQIPWESTSLEDDFFFNEPKSAQVVPLEKAREAAFPQEKADWDKIKASRVANDFYEFLNKYPSGLISETAQDKLQRLDTAKVTATPVQGRDAITRRTIRLGDTTEYVYRDLLTQLEQKRETLKVTSVTDELIEFNGGKVVWTVGGATVKNDQGLEFDPPVQTLPVGDIQLGKRWATRSNFLVPHRNVRGWTEEDSFVVGYEDIEVPAGRFKAWRIETKMRTEGGLFAQITNWVTSDGRLVKYVRKGRTRDGKDASWMREMTRFEPGPG
ncbi:caspase domain-containing protein [Acidovorax sp. 69]|uniref:caspase family protein n=1 Tax=Acidovorax sp. 69 TaxID=2035202 RepID=UPI000C250A66|nr:caspase family protein [Acidovorax sp. 69]PJI95705.1 caspase domain-containing protein [Acidovorax sp. 69]